MNFLPLIIVSLVCGGAVGFLTHACAQFYDENLPDYPARTPEQQLAVQEFQHRLVNRVFVISSVLFLLAGFLLGWW